jgi:aminoglycoside/choline kinase family phosphotransferase
MIPDIQQIESLLTGLNPKAISLVKLQGDASTRSYFRISFLQGEVPQTRILMVLGQSDRGIRSHSEEATSRGEVECAELPFINVQRHLRACGVAVPEILHYDAARGWMLLEDLGDQTLSEAIRGASEAQIEVLYRKAIDLLIQMQRKGGQGTSVAAGRSFDQALLRWEFDHFIEYGIEARQGSPLPEKAGREIRAWFSDIALRLSLLPRVFTHRDYHSRNLMVQSPGDPIRVLDFQDALMGPCQYDLASLLRDAYVELPEALIDRLIAYYLDGMGEQPLFRELFDLMSIQRNLKAAGRFVYIDKVKGNDRFLQYVPPTLAKVRRNLLKDRRLMPLHQLLSEFVPELQR